MEEITLQKICSCYIRKSPFLFSIRHLNLVNLFFPFLSLISICISFAASKLLNPVALFRTASSRSSSSRFLVNSSSTREEGNEGTKKNISEEHCMLSGSHQSTLDRLNTWEKKLYEEVKVYY